MIDDGSNDKDFKTPDQLSNYYQSLIKAGYNAGLASK